MDRLQETHRRNVLMIRLLICFFLVSLAVNLVVDKTIYVLNPPIAPVLGVVLVLMVASRRLPDLTMCLIIASPYVFLLMLSLENPYLVNFLFLGLLPLFTLLYLNYHAVLLTGVLYMITAVFMFQKFHKEMFPGVDSSDQVYIMVWGLFMTMFSLVLTKYIKKLWVKVEQSGSRLNSILENVEIAAWSYDLSGGHMELSEGIVHISGWPKSQFAGDYRVLSDIVFPEDQHIITQIQKEMMLERKSVRTECRIIRKDGESRWVQIRGTPIFNPRGNLERLEGVILDISERKRLEEQVEFLAYHDELTELPNRTMFKKQFDRYLSEGAQLLAIMFIDLDNFKEVNDEFGHSAGDYLLREIAGRLSGQIRNEDIACRIGGDEFLLMLAGSDAKRASVVAERILSNLSRPVEYRGRQLIVTPSIGVCVHEGGPCDLDVLIHKADEAMYEAKREGRNQYFVQS